MILGELLWTPIADQVDSAVADMSVVQLPMFQNGGAAGGAHSAQFGFNPCVVQDGMVGRLKARYQRLARVVPGLVEKDASDGVRGQPAGDLAPGAAAHAVGY